MTQERKVDFGFGCMRLPVLQKDQPDSFDYEKIERLFDAFLERYDLTGKRILPFCTNEGSGLGVSERDIKNICKGAEIEKGLSIHGAEAADSRNKVEVWLEELNI